MKTETKSMSTSSKRFRTLVTALFIANKTLEDIYVSGVLEDKKAQKTLSAVQLSASAVSGILGDILVAQKIGGVSDITGDDLLSTMPEERRKRLTE